MHGFEFQDFPLHLKPANQLLICDMSSNITTKPIDWGAYDVVYAGAQKNLGPSGCTLVVVRNSVLDQKK